MLHITYITQGLKFLVKNETVYELTENRMLLLNNMSNAYLSTNEMKITKEKDIRFGYPVIKQSLPRTVKCF
jgi:hypothetical protein